MSVYPDRLARERRHFDRLVVETGESWWGHTTRAGRRRLQRRARIVADQLGGLPGTEVLELGCGTGALTVELLDVLPEINLTAGDLSPRSLDIARHKCRDHANVIFESQDVLALQHDDASFDVVVGNSILHHVPLAPALAEIHRVLRDGGRMLFFEPNRVNPQLAVENSWLRGLVANRLQYSDDERPFVRWSLRHRIGQAGFASVAVEPMDFLHPLTPQKLVRFVDRLGRIAEQVPLVREISGSLLVTATKSTCTSGSHFARNIDRLQAAALT